MFSDSIQHISSDYAFGMQMPGFAIDNQNATISYIYDKFLRDQNEGEDGQASQSMIHMLIEIYRGQITEPIASDIVMATVTLDKLVEHVTGIKQISKQPGESIESRSIRKDAKALFSQPHLSEVVNLYTFDIRSLVISALKKQPINYSRLWNATRRQNSTVYTTATPSTEITRLLRSADATGSQILTRQEYKEKGNVRSSTFSVLSVQDGSMLHHVAQADGMHKMSLATSAYEMLSISCDVMHTSFMRTHNGKSYEISHCIGAVNLFPDVAILNTSFMTHIPARLANDSEFSGTISFMESGAAFKDNTAIMHTFHLAEKPKDKSALLLPVVEMILHLASTVAMQIRSICSRYVKVARSNPEGAFNVEPDVGLVYGNKWPFAMHNLLPLAIDRALAQILDTNRSYTIIPHSAIRPATRPIFDEAPSMTEMPSTRQLTSYFADLKRDLETHTMNESAVLAHDLLFSDEYGCLTLLGATLSIRNSLSTRGEEPGENFVKSIAPLMLQREQAITCVKRILRTHPQNIETSLMSLSIAQQAHDHYIM